TTRPQPGPSRPSASLLPDSADYQSHPGLIPDDPNRSGPGSTNLTAPARIRPPSPRPAPPPPPPTRHPPPLLPGLGDYPSPPVPSQADLPDRSSATRLVFPPPPSP